MTSLADILLPDQGDNIIRTKEIEINPDVRGVGEQLFKAMVRYKDRVAQIDAETGESDTFSELLTRSVRVAVNLKRMGVTPEDILTPCSECYRDTVILLIAIIFTGAKVSTIDPFYPDDERTEQLDLIKPKLMFCSQIALQRAVAIVEKLKLDTKIILFGKSDKYMSFDELLVPHIQEEEAFLPYIPKNIFETFLIVFSSGSTGVPKGICLHHHLILNTFSSMPSNANKTPSIFMMFFELVWSADMMYICYNFLLGNTILICRYFDANRTLKYMEKYKVTNSFLMPSEILEVVDAKPLDLKLPHLKVILCTGAPFSADGMIRARNALPGTNILLNYGQTECGSATRFLIGDTKKAFNKPGSCGGPFHSCQIKICDLKSRKPLGPNQPGELCIKSKRIMVDYYNQDSSGRYDSEGYLKTGDILYYDEDYCFYFVERIGNVLRYKLITINPVEIEGLLQEHPGVEFAVVLGFPTVNGDIPVGVIVKNNKDVTEKELEDFVAARVDPRKKLHGGVVFVERSFIPFTPSGKVRRKALKEKMLEEHKFQFNGNLESST